MPGNSSQKQISIIGGRVILALLGVSMALILAESAARQFLGRPYMEDNGDLWTCERLIGWRGKPDTTTRINTQGYVHEVVRNSAGMHDKEHPIEKAAGVFRILVLGDSFVEARQVAGHESSHSILEKALNATAPANIRFEVISAGASAWGPAQELMYFRTEGQLYQPNLVLAFWYPANDLMDVLPDHRMTFEGVNCYAPYFAVCTGKFDPEPWFSAPGIPPTHASCSASKKTLTNLLNLLYHHSRLYQHLEPLLAKRQSKLKYAFDFSPWLEGTPDETLAYAYQVTDGIYTQLAHEAAQAGAKTAMVIVPLKQAIYYQLGSPYREQIEAGYPQLKQANPNLPNQVMTQLMAAKGIPVFDLQPPFVAHLQAGGGVLYWDVDSHWNVPGNQLAGELIAQWLIEQKLVPIDPSVSR